jgi:hypothetical protein
LGDREKSFHQRSSNSNRLMGVGAAALVEVIFVLAKHFQK